jgi:cbb3-type cytochrome oxidase subunit 3
METAGYLFHHLVCIGGLFPSVIHGHDGSMVMLGFIGGEISNPSRGLCEYVEFELTAMRERFQAIGKANFTKNGHDLRAALTAYNKLFQFNELLHQIYFVLFMVFRFLLSKYVFFAILPNCKSGWSYASAIAMFIFSVGSVFIILGGRSKKSAQMTSLVTPFPEEADTDKKTI